MPYNFNQLYNVIYRFPQLPKQDQDEVVGLLCDPKYTKEYSYINYVSQISQHLDGKTILKLFDSVINNYPAYRTYYEDGFLEFLKKSYDADNVAVKAQLLAKKDTIYGKALLLLDGLTTDEEERGLRALSQRKYCPPSLLRKKYAPRKEAILRLPPIMRLKVLETLSNHRHLAYNVFEHFDDPDEFKGLMFSSVLRHRERAEVVWNKYKEIAYLGQEATITIKSNCINCGEFKLTLESKRIRTKTGLQQTQLWNSFRYGGCSLCGDRQVSVNVYEGSKEVEAVGE